MVSHNACINNIIIINQKSEIKSDERKYSKISGTNLVYGVLI